MSDKNKVSAVQKAKLEFDSIVNLAKENLLKESEDKINKLIEDAIEEVQKEEMEENRSVVAETEESVVNESEMKIETPDMKIVVDADGSVSVDHKEPEGGEEASSEPVDAVTQKPVDVTKVISAPDDEDIEITADEEPIEVTAEADANQQPQMNANETMPPAGADPAASAPAPSPVPAPAPVEAGGMSAEEELLDAIKKMIAQATGGSADAGGDEGVDIVDDEVGVGAAAPAPAAPAPVAEDVTLEEDELIELELEEDDAVMDEMKMMGVSNTVKRKAGNPSGPAVSAKNRALADDQKMNESTDKVNAHYEATIAELKKENEGLKGQLKEFKNSFIEMREQWNEVQNFQKKLSLAYRVIANGGLTEKEKARISERFEAAKDAEEAEKIYKEIISEKNVPQDKGTLKSSAIPVAKSKKEAIYESTAVQRARVLAGIERADQE